MTKMLTRAFPLLCAAGLLLGCEEDPKRPFPGAGTAQPLAVDNGLFYTFDFGETEPEATRRSGAALQIDLAGEEPRIVEHELEPGVTRSAQRPGHAGEVLVLTSGHDQYRRGNKAMDANNAVLSLFTRDNNVASWPLRSQFRELVVSDDGRYAVAYAPSGNQAAQNAIALVDLDKPASDPASIVQRTLGFDGRAPTRLVFSPAGQFAPRLLVVVFPDAIQLLNLDRPTSGEVEVALKTANDPRTLQPDKLVFVKDRIYIASGSSNQVMVLQLLAAPDTAQGFRPAPSFLTATANVSDIAVAGRDDEQRVLAVANGLQIADPDVGEWTRVETPRPFSSVLAFEGVAPSDPQPASRAMLYQIGQPRVGFVEVGGQSTWSSRSVELVELGEPLAAILPLQSRKVVLGLHSAARLSIIELEARRVTPIRLESPLASYLVDETDARVRVWTANTSGVVAVLEYPGLGSTPIPVVLEHRAPYGGDQAPLRHDGSMVLIPGSPRRVALVHPSETGRITLLDADFDANMPKETLQANDLTGFLLTSMFD